MNGKKPYFINCFLLTIPIIIWNILVTPRLPKAFQPEIFWKDMPAFLTYGENISRAILFLLTYLMPLQVLTKTQKRGLAIYIAGTVLYFASWLGLIYFPNSLWSNSLLGFAAPAYTPLLWLTGIGLIGNSFSLDIPYSRIYFILAVFIFLILHNLHTIIVYFRNYYFL